MSTPGVGAASPPAPASSPPSGPPLVTSPSPPEGRPGSTSSDRSTPIATSDRIPRDVVVLYVEDGRVAMRLVNAALAKLRPFGWTVFFVRNREDALRAVNGRAFMHYPNPDRN